MSPAARQQASARQHPGRTPRRYPKPSQTGHIERALHLLHGRTDTTEHSLELNLQRELADSGIPRAHDIAKASGDYACSGIVEVGAIEDVEELGAKLNPQALPDCQILRCPQICTEKSGAAQRSFRQVAVGP